MAKILGLMPFEELPFNGDTYVEKEFLELKILFNIKSAIETGTCLGSSTIFLSENFEDVQTIEINQKFLDIAKSRCKNKENITFYQGDSAELIEEAIKNVKHKDNIIFFIDSHWGNHCPLQSELLKISEYAVNPIIAIHDFKVPNEENLGYDSINGQPFTFEWLKKYFDEIYPDGYDYHYNSDKESTEVKRGIVYLYPKIRK